MGGGNICVSPLWLSMTLAILWKVCLELSLPGLAPAPGAHSQRALKPKLADWCFWCRNIPVVETQQDNLSQTTTNTPSLGSWFTAAWMCHLRSPSGTQPSVCLVHCTAAWYRHETLCEEVSWCLPWFLGNPAVSWLGTALHVVPGKVHQGREMGPETWGEAR